MIRLTAVLLLVACTTQADLTVPVSGTSTPPTTTVWTGDTATRLPPTTVVDYDAEWKAFVRETLAVHAQKPEHPFWSAARTQARSSAPVDIGAEMYAIQAEINQALQFLAAPEPKRQTLEQLVDQFFAEADRPWALRVAFCESSAQPGDVSSDAIHPSSRASGWFQHLPKFWQERSDAAGFAGEPILDPVANVGVAAWLLYDGGGKSHWYPSERCWQ
jgi:hypothetical protein